MRIVLAAGALAAFEVCAPAQSQGISDPGERAFSYCFSCHTIDPNEEAPLTGPKLIGVVGKSMASRDDYEYTDEFREFAKGKVWTPELILQWIQDPQAMVADTRMEKPPGPRTEEERTALIEYLKAH